MQVKLTAPIKHNGKDCKAGDLLDTSESNAKYLVSLGFAEIATATEKKPLVGSAELSLEEIELMSMDKLKQELSLRNIKFKPNANKSDLIELLEEAISKEKNE